MKLTDVTAFAKNLPRLTRELWRYARYRRALWHELEARQGGVTPIESVSLLEALKRVHSYRFPERDWPTTPTYSLKAGDDLEDREMLFLAMLCLTVQPKAIFEIGTYEGRTANVMALHTDEACRICTLDLPPEQAGQTKWAVGDYDRKLQGKEGTQLAKRLGSLPDPEDNARIQQLFGDSANFDYGPYREQMDLVFVDGAHSFDYVMSDTAKALTMIAERGIILLHDYQSNEDVTLAATVLRKSHEVIHLSEMTFAILFPRAQAK